MNLAYSIEFQAMKRGDQTAVIFQEVHYNYRYMNDLANQYALILRDLGVTKGDRVSIWLPNGLHFIGAFFGILKLGGLAVPMNILYKEAEVSHILANAEVKALITQTSHLPIIKEAMDKLPYLEKVIFADDVRENGTESERFTFFSPIKRERDSPFFAMDLSPDDGAVILYTSGTTGVPKGVVLTHYNLQTNAEFYADHIGLTDKHFGCIVTPLSHLLMLMAGLVLIFQKGGKFYLFEKFDKEAVARKIKNLQINFFIGVPAMYYMFLTLPEVEEFDLSSLYICITSGAQMPLEVRKKFEERFSTLTIQVYGQTESSPVITLDRFDKERKFESVGYPMSHLEVKIINPSGNEVSRGETGEIIARGHCVMKEYWKNPEATGKMHVTKEEIIEFCFSKMAKYKVVREVEFIDEIPKTVTGKLLKRKLKEHYVKS